MPSKVELLKKYVWMVDAFAHGQRLTFQEISDKWLDSNSWEEPLVLRTFHRYRKSIRELFGIDIVWDVKGSAAIPAKAIKPPAIFALFAFFFFLTNISAAFPTHRIGNSLRSMAVFSYSFVLTVVPLSFPFVSISDKFEK